MKLVIRIIICLAFLLGFIALFYFGLEVFGGEVEHYRKSSGIPILVLSLAPFSLGIALLYVLVNDLRYIRRFGYKSFQNAAKESSVHKVFPFLRR